MSYSTEGTCCKRNQYCWFSSRIYDSHS